MEEIKRLKAAKKLRIGTIDSSTAALKVTEPTNLTPGFASTVCFRALSKRSRLMPLGVGFSGRWLDHPRKKNRSVPPPPPPFLFLRRWKVTIPVD